MKEPPREKRLPPGVSRQAGAESARNVMGREVTAEVRDHADRFGEGEVGADLPPVGGASTPERTHVPTLESRRGRAHSGSGSTEPETLEAHNVHADCTYRYDQLSAPVPHSESCHDAKLAARRPGDLGVAAYRTPSALGVGVRRRRVQPSRDALDGDRLAVSIVGILPPAP